MQIFALETRIERTKSKFLASGEQEIFTARQHAFSFATKVAWEILVTIVLIAATGVALWFDIVTFPVAVSILLILWVFLALKGIINGYIRWKFTTLLLTTDKLVIVDQVSLFRKSITPINLENMGDVVAQTQWLNLFNFGIIHFALKEGHGPEIVLPFMPHADRLVAKIAQQITLYQRRKDFITPYRTNNAS